MVRSGIEGRMTTTREPRASGRFWREWVRPLGTTALLVFGLRSAVADWNDVPTGSMRPSILVGDRVFVNRLAYDLKVPFTTWHVAEWAAPERGDVVVFYSPADGKRLVKRVVGVPGDEIAMRGNRLVLNGEEIECGPPAQRMAAGIPEAELPRRVLAEEQLPGRPHPVMAMTDRMARRDFDAVRVPEGHYFMMGDSRDDSFDSRFFGVVPRRSILGRATAVVASMDPERHYAPRWSRWFSPMP